MNEYTRDSKINKGMMRMTKLQQFARLRAIVRTMGRGGEKPLPTNRHIIIITLVPRGQLGALYIGRMRGI